jgi:hypothetical protein
MRYAERPLESFAAALQGARTKLQQATPLFFAVPAIAVALTGADDVGLPKI